MNSDYLVTKSNYFIMNSSYDLSLEEQKLILTLASMVQPDDEEFKPYIFRISDFMKLLGVDTKTKYTEVPKLTKELMKKVFEIEEGKKTIQIAWLSSAIYEKGTGFVELEFSPRLKPYMLKLNSMFTQYKLANILSMKSKYSPRIYELLKCNEFKKQKYIDISIDDLRKILKIENLYPRYYDFKRYILETTKKELKNLTDVYFEFEEIKVGRKVTSLRFYIKSNNKKISNSISAADEIAATISMEEEAKVSSEDEVKSIILMMKDHNISALEARKIYNSACGDLKHISKIYNYFKNKNADNFVALMIKMVKPGEFIEPKKNAAKTKFNNFNGRDYDYDELEKKLLGWD